MGWWVERGYWVSTAVAYSVADPDPGSGAFLTPRSGMNNQIHISECLETIFLGVKRLNFFDADPGWKKLGSGINIPNPQHWVLSFRREFKVSLPY
jgi:hypothetical protein